MRGRLTALLFIAAIPLCLMAGFIAVQNYRIVAHRPDDRAVLTSTALVARYDVVLEGAALALDELARDARISDGDTAGCGAAIAAAVSRWRRMFVDLAFVPFGVRAGAAGDAFGCRAGFNPSQAVPRTDLGAVSLAADLVVLGVAPLRGAESARVLRVGFPVGEPGALRGALIADVAVGLLPSVAQSLLTDGTAAWLIVGPERIALGASRDAALPENTAMAALFDQATPRTAASRDGALFDYLASPLRGGLRLLVAIPASADFASAEQVLARRIAELGLLCLGGLVLVAIGANIAVVEPLKDLTHAVRRWRGGGPFDPGDTTAKPREFQELTTSFSEAVAALSERERQLRLAMTQQDLLMQEIHHRVKNNLQIIASLMNLQASRIRQPEAKAEFQSARDRIRALATLHRHLYAHGELHTINMRGFLTELCGQLLQAIGEAPLSPVADLATASRIRLHIEAPELQISSDQAVPMALIVTEAVSNAAKYAFPAGRRGSIAVRLTTEGDSALLVIEDDGVGIPAGRAETETGIRDGLGIQLIRGFARQLGGTLTVTEEAGTRYALNVTLRRARLETDPAPHVEGVSDGV